MSYLIFFTLISPRKTLVQLVLALEQESNLPYIKNVIKKILQTTDPPHSSLDAIIFLFLNISNIILDNANFRNFKTNQLLGKERYKIRLIHVLLYFHKISNVSSFTKDIVKLL